MTRIFRSTVAPVLALALWGSAQAASLYELPASTGVLETPGGVSVRFDSGAGAAAVSLQLQGYATLDGDNFWIDIASVTLDGQLLLQGTWDLGGGGVDRVLANPGQALWVKTAASQTLDVDLGLKLAAGQHTLRVTYDSPLQFEGMDRAGPQGLGDEGWGVNRLRVTGVSPVPEPATMALWLAGLAGLGLRRSRRG